MFFEMFHYWQAWLAIAVIIGGVKLLDMALGVWRDHREDVLYQRAFEKSRLAKLEEACFGCAGPVLQTGQPSLWRQLKDIGTQLAAVRGSISAQIDRVRAECENRNTDTCKLIDKKISDIAPIFFDHAKALDDLTERMKALEAPKECCAEKPAKAAAPRPAPAKKAATTITRRSAR